MHFSKQNSTFLAELYSHLKISGGFEPPCLSPHFGPVYNHILLKVPVEIPCHCYCYFNNVTNNKNNFIYPSKRPASQSTNVDRVVLIGDEYTRIYKMLT